MTSSTIKIHGITSPYAEAAEFLEALFHGAPDDHYLELRPITPRGASKKEVSRSYHTIRDLKDGTNILASSIALDGKMNNYYGVAPRKRKGGTADDVGVAGAIWFDEITRPAPDLPPFSWVVETSPGKVQGGYFLTDYTEDLDQVEALNDRLGHAVGGDHIWDRARILRLPGFRNMNHPEGPRSYLLEFHPDLRYSLDQLDAALPALPPDQSEGRERREYTGRFEPHFGTPLKSDDQTRLTLFLPELGLRHQYDGRFFGACPFDHGGIACDCDSAFYISAQTGNWKCFCSDHRGRSSGGVRALRKLGFRAATPFTPFPEDEEDSTVRGRWGELHAKKAALEALIQEADVEYFPLKLYGEKLVILQEDTRLAVSKERLMEMLPLVSRDDDPLLLRLSECGHRFGKDCIDHGRRGVSVRTCKTQFHAACPTKTASKLAQIELPDREGDQSYREVWLESNVILGDSGGSEVQDRLETPLKAWVTAVAKVARRKQYKGKVLHRSYSITLGKVARMHWKVMFLEDAPGEADDAIAQLCADMGAIIVGDNAYHRGESALLQMMSDASCTLAGMTEDNPSWFEGYYWATKGRHTFQGMADIYRELKKVPPPEKVVCDYPGCGKELTFIRITDGVQPDLQEAPPPRGGPTQGELMAAWR